MRELVEFVAKSLVDKPEDVIVTEKKRDKTIIIELKVAQEDMGKVIGKSGRIAKALRTVVNAAAAKNNLDVVLDILG
ncbi:hypothetical protein SAMN02745227_00176 [Anaerobranca californiensis DSM 14826]|jgi:predicted RNA-binding protein YlqC (UPF0109 family)|uniref:RNA-binding protein KhpA n=1 Tax=Anaerobranca californiensis DSM 14826 TaxID=1120989 RepID=A0A1M6KM74_9FIRM|nr:KH domain-containing protein [Anaerobranca californiensis]SHJ60083.1 hypothetical protein SAMN02745227_00176 [Anaerobranca californiensis DSM 14826]